jgi:hypothetical protein
MCTSGSWPLGCGMGLAEVRLEGGRNFKTVQILKIYPI